MEQDPENPTGMVLVKKIWTDTAEVEAPFEIDCSPVDTAIVKAGTGWGNKKKGGSGWGKDAGGGGGWSSGGWGSGGWHKKDKEYPQFCYLCKRKTYMGKNSNTNMEDNTTHRLLRATCF